MIIISLDPNVVVFARTSPLVRANDHRKVDTSTFRCTTKRTAPRVPSSLLINKYSKFPLGRARCDISLFPVDLRLLSVTYLDLSSTYNHPWIILRSSLPSGIRGVVVGTANCTFPIIRSSLFIVAPISTKKYSQR